MTSNIRTLFRYIIFVVIGYLLAFVFLLTLFGLLEVTGWYVVYIPFLAILGSVVALFFINLSKNR